MGTITVTVRVTLEKEGATLGAFEASDDVEGQGADNLEQLLRDYMLQNKSMALLGLQGFFMQANAAYAHLHKGLWLAWRAVTVKPRDDARGNN